VSTDPKLRTNRRVPALIGTVFVVVGAVLIAVQVFTTPILVTLGFADGAPVQPWLLSVSGWLLCGAVSTVVGLLIFAFEVGHRSRKRVASL
jgi:hypothetical protein